jgi:NADPH:quinone reductase-like Zn-dependent oxidoreductase
MHEYGGPEVLVCEEAPQPAAGPGEVLIEVHAAGVNAMDLSVRSGAAEGWLHHKLPLIPGWDVSGEIQAVGPGVRGWIPGDAVYGKLDFEHDGAYAEYAVGTAADLASVPAGLDHIQMAAVPTAGLAAWQCLFELAGLQAGQTVLIHGAAGGVGHYAVQFARWKGAQVIGTAAGGDVDFVVALGAAHVVDYKTKRFEDVAAEVDVVLDPIGGETQERSWAVLREGGVLVSTKGIASPQKGEAMGLRSEALSVRGDREHLTRIAELVEAGEVKPFVHTVLPLTQAARAHELFAGGQVHGKIVLKVR